MRGRYINANLIREAFPPIAFYDKYLEHSPKRTHRIWQACCFCPFCDEEHGNFYVNIKSGAFKCHTCDVGGASIIAFTMRLHKLEFREALEQLDATLENWHG